MKFFKDNLNYINAKLIKKFFNDNYHLIILVILFYVFVSIQISALFSVSFLDGESSILSNPIIEYSKYGLWHYPFHSQSLWMAGIDEFIIHPPLHYYISSIFVNIFGIGTWQVLLTSSVAAILMTGSVAFFLFKTYNWFTSATYLTLISVFYGFYYSSLSVRPDLSFGAIFTLYLL